MTTKEDIKRWLSLAKEDHSHMIVVCDTFDYTDYPVYVKITENVKEIEAKYSDSQKMSRVMEVYNLKKDINIQLKEHRSFNY